MYFCSVSMFAISYALRRANCFKGSRAYKADVYHIRYSTRRYNNSLSVAAAFFVSRTITCVDRSECNLAAIRFPQPSHWPLFLCCLQTHSAAVQLIYCIGNGLRAVRHGANKVLTNTAGANNNQTCKMLYRVFASAATKSDW